jgi:arabinofuranosyltransferase
MSRFELLQQGYHYLMSSFHHDLILALGLVAGVSYAAVKANRRLQALATGGALYFFYILYVGGDFMIGRFYTPILFIAVIMLVRTVEIPAEPQKRFRSVTTVLLLLLVLSVALPGSPMLLQTIASGAEYSDTNINKHGIADERGYYYQNTGLIANKERKKHSVGLTMVGSWPILRQMLRSTQPSVWMVTTLAHTYILLIRMLCQIHS